MNALSIVENVSSSLVCRESKSGALAWRAMNRKAFAGTEAGQGLKGRALKKAHWDYLQRCSGELNGAASSEIAAGRIVVTGIAANAKGTGGTIKFETAAHFARHEAIETVRKNLNETDALTLLAKKHGLTVEQLSNLLKK